MTGTNGEDYPRLAAAARRLALEAGRTIMTFYRDGAAVETKEDHSPVTEADKAADRIIVSGLRAADPRIPIVSEESTDVRNSAPHAGRYFWLVDPLDGTREFIARTGEFTVNIALIEAGRPVLGVLHAPAQGETYVADVQGGAVRFVGEGGSANDPREAGARRGPRSDRQPFAPRRRDRCVHRRIAAVPDRKCRQRPEIRLSLRGVRPISTRASAAPWSGTPRRVRRYSRQRAAMSAI